LAGKSNGSSGWGEEEIRRDADTRDDEEREEEGEANVARFFQHEEMGTRENASGGGMFHCCIIFLFVP
jgi:hypothetical protein